MTRGDKRYIQNSNTMQTDKKRQEIYTNSNTMHKAQQGIEGTRDSIHGRRIKLQNRFFKKTFSTQLIEGTEAK